MPVVVRGRSYSLPSSYGLQNAVQGGPCLASPVPPQVTELSELKELLMQQQEQLNQLTQTIASLQTHSSYSQPPRSGPGVSSQVILPECNGLRVPYHHRTCSTNGSPAFQQLENWSPLSCWSSDGGCTDSLRGKGLDHPWWGDEVGFQYLFGTALWLFCPVWASRDWLASWASSFPRLVQVHRGTVYIP